MEKYDFSGWATRNDIRCSDGRTIRRNAFAHNDGMTVPLVWNHQHNDPLNVLGHALLENRPEGVYAYCAFNDTESGRAAKETVMHGDISSLSIYANQLKQQGGDVLHGQIREVSLVYAGANPKALIDSVIKHGELCEEEAIIYTGETISLYHSDEKEESKMANGNDGGKTVKEVFDSLTEEQKTAVYALIGVAVEDALGENDEGDDDVKHNVFDQDERYEDNYLSHSDEMAIVELAKKSTWKDALENYLGDATGTLQHGIDDIETLFPEAKNLNPGAPEMLTSDQGWISTVLNKVHKSPFAKIKTRQADARIEELKARAHTKGEQKQLMAKIKLMGRTTESQMVYVMDTLQREDIINITDFDAVQYNYGIMRMTLNETIASAIMIGDGREDGEAAKISEEKIRPIWTDDDLYTIHAAIDMAAAKASVQGSDTSVYFSNDFVRANAIRAAALQARNDYKGSGHLEFYCTPSTVTSMLLANDRNGHPICSSKSAMADQLDVSAVHTVEQFNNKIRTTADGKKMKLIGIMVNLGDYTTGCVKGGEITRFEQFNIDFNNYKYLMETFLCGALTKPYSAIVIEEEVTE